MNKYYIVLLGSMLMTSSLEAAPLILPTDSVAVQDTLLNRLIGEVVVSAGRMPQKLSSIPGSITLVTHKELVQMTEFSTDMNDILSLKVPGLAPQAGGYSNWGQTLRGRKLLTMVDGVPISTPLRPGQVDMNNINPNDLERVEVIKGATAIFGNGGDGGFINYITRTPSGNRPISGTTQLWGMLNLAKIGRSLGGGFYQSLKGRVRRLSYWGSLGYEQTGSQYDAHGVPLFPTYSSGNTRKYSGFGKLVYQLADNQRIVLSANYYKARQESPYEPVLSELKVLNANGDYLLAPGYGKEKGTDYPEKPMGPTSFSSLLKYTLSDIFQGTTTFTTDFYYQKSKDIFFYSKSFEHGGQSVINSRKFGLRPNFVTNLESESIKTSLVYGVDVIQDRTNQALLDGRLWIPDMSLHGAAPYVQADFRIKDAVTLKAGIRYDAMSIGIDDYHTLPYSPKQDGNFNPAVAVAGGRLSFDRLSFNLGIRYIANEKLIPYLSFSQGFSLPDIGRILRETDSPDVVRNIEVQAIATNNYEIGFLTYLNAFRIEASAYYSSSNIGTGLAFDDERNRFEQAMTPQHIFGGEISADMRLFQDKLLAGGSFSWVEGLTNKAKDDKTFVYVRGDVISPAKLTGYMSYRITPKLSSNVNVIYVGNRKRFNPTATKENGWKFNNGEVPVKGYAVVNLSMSYGFLPNLKMALAANNLLNHYYIPARSQWAAPLRNQSGVGEGANIKLTLRYDF